MLERLLSIKHLVDNGLDDIIEKSIETIDFQSYGEYLLSLDNYSDEDREGLSLLLNIAQYIETETTMESILTDEVYDKLHSLYYTLTGHKIVGTNNTKTSNRPTKQHLYPELRGSLDKVHFIWERNKGPKDSRESLEHWLTNAFNVTGEKFFNVGIACKFDGLSGVFECEKDDIKDVVSRKDTESNEGVVLNHILNGDTFVEHTFRDKLPLIDLKGKAFGVQTEIYVNLDDFGRMKENLSRPPKNHRSAATMIVNTIPKNYNPEWSQYLTVEPLKISSSAKISDTRWLYNGHENGRYQYIPSDTRLYETAIINSVMIDSFLEYVETNAIPMFQNYAELHSIPIDGIVISILDEDAIEKLGRSGSINKYQVAFKFPAGIKKSTLKEVKFQVGHVAGTVTPVAKIEPIVIMGNTISSIGLSNYDKLERLNLHVGDEVKIKYDIIPTLFKDSSCKEARGQQIMGVTKCPVPGCGAELDIVVNPETGLRTARCINPDCPSKLVGKIYNYINKMGIENVGEGIVADFVEAGVLTSIPDLYRLESKRDFIENMKGYGSKKLNNILAGINARLVVYPHELFGAIGIPSVGKKTMEKVFREFTAFDLMYGGGFKMTMRLSNVDGIGEITAGKIMKGIFDHLELLEELLNHYIKLKDYADKPASNFKVCFHMIRDKEFAKLLEEKYNFEIQDNLTKSTSLMIVPKLDIQSAKMTKARENHIKVMTLDDAKKLYV